MHVDVLTDLCADAGSTPAGSTMTARAGSSGGFACVPSMTGDLGVRVPRKVGRGDPSEPQGEMKTTREGGAERSG
jgi:hypothetical protein